MKDTERAILAALTDLSGIGDARAYDLFTHFDDPTTLIDPPDTIIEEYHYVDADTYTTLQTLDEEIKAYCRRFEEYDDDGVTILGIEDDQYPDCVREGPAPVLLYAKGNLKLLNETGIGVSGSRETNEVGQQWIHSVTSDLAQGGYTVISGGARGADTAAHNGALDSTESTIAVLGTGVNVAYPPENKSLFDRIVETDGLLVSMRPPEAEPTRHSFFDRNELIAALSNAMIFVATDGSGGTMAQYEIAIEQERPTFAPPNNLGIEPSDGLVHLQDSTETTIIETAAELTNSLSTTESGQLQLDDWT